MTSLYHLHTPFVIAFFLFTALFVLWQARRD